MRLGRGRLVRPARWWGLCLAAALAAAGRPAFAGDGGALPLGRGSGGLAVSTEPVDALRRLGREAKTRTERVGRKELEQVLVVPQRPGKNNVRYYDFDWRRFDFLDQNGVGGVRFYFYERESETARTAAALVRDEYEELALRFHYRPTAQVPYILYNSHREFENTNVFFVNEYILGVTSPLDLRMALPYWGEQQRFREVSTHEMVHQFTIQKMADRAAAAGVDSPIMSMPLWFVEGLAEYYAKRGIDHETDLFARDMLLNPRPDKGYAVQPFWEDSPGSFLYTYKLGQLKVAFLAEQYGERIVQGLLDQSPRLSGGNRGLHSEAREGFQELVTRLSGEKPEVVAQRYSAWFKRRYLPAYLNARQEPPALSPVELTGEPDAFSVGPDGFTVLYRAVERESGRSRLYLVDRRDPASVIQVAVDGQPGLESLHPVLRGVTAVGRDRLAFLARHGPADALYVVPYTRRQTGARVELELGTRQRIDLSHADLIEAGDPAFSPDGGRVAFFGLDAVGKIDLWTAEVATGKLVRLTNDGYAERDVAWVDESPAQYGLAVGPGGGGAGTLIYATDRTAHRRYNLEALDPETGKSARLTDEEADERAPCPLGGGQVVFSSDAGGKQDLQLYDGPAGKVTRLTDFVTGLSAPAPGPKGLMALGFYGGQFRIFDVPTDQLLSLDERPARGAGGEMAAAAALPEEPIPPDADEYQPFARRNWRLENGVAAIGTYSVGQAALLFGDVLSDRNVILQVAMFGSPSLTDATAFYLDKSQRQVFGFGPFHTFTQRRDTSAPGFGNDVFYLQREFGLSGLWSYPFDTFTRVEARAVAQGVKREFQFPLDAEGFMTTAIDLDSLRTWRAEHGGYDLEALASLRLGYDTTRFRYPGGPFGGGSFLVEGGAGYLPLRAATHGYATADAQYHQRILGFSTLHLRVAAAVSGGSVFGRQFFLSSYDNLRNYAVNDRRLLGTTYAVTNADLAVPLDTIVKLVLVSNVEGVLGLDFGGVASDVHELWSHRTFAFVLGFNLGLGPFEIRVHFARPVNIGGVVQQDGWVPNISLRYAYF